ncbi:MAG: hypothetical protein C5B50_10740 [Verrucomicrobia bacterium]|nr:MAG: hypothetical protein C5B50_10740 [Verrucomicrobiota bacterium]
MYQCSFVAALAAAVNLTLASAAPVEEAGQPNVVHLPNPYSGHISSGKGGHRSGGSSIKYHGGPVMLGTVKVYAIWYGGWTFDGTFSNPTTIVADFLHVIGGSPYYNINTTYYMSLNGANAFVTNSVAYAGAFTDNYSQGAGPLSDFQIEEIVAGAINSSGAGPDPNGIYFVLTSPDVTKSGFCSSYCGWHTHAYIDGVDVKYSFVGDAAIQCPGGCTANTGVSPNGDVGGDGMVSIIAHELEEAASDEDLNAWYDSGGYENADKCAWTFGTVHRLSNGAWWNMILPDPTAQPGNTTTSRYYLIQRNWVNSGSGYCALSY